VEEQDYIPFSVPEIGEEEIAEVVNTLKSGWLTSGVKTQQFEKEFREYTGAKQSLALNSCTAALHVAMIALDIKPGDEVITTPLTFCATVNTILHVGAKPVLADIGEDGNIDPIEIERKITNKTKAILPVHLAGLPCEMDAIWKLARVHKLKVIEDAAHAVGTHYRGKHIGSATSKSDAVAYSFYATKNLTTGEGGMVTTNSKALLDRMRILALHGIGRDAWNRYGRHGSWFYEVLEAGFKYNLSDLQSSIGIHQLRKLEQFAQIREQRAALYSHLLRDVEEIELPATRANTRHAWHLYALRLRLDKLKIDRNQFIEQLRERNIGTSVHFIPIPLHPYYSSWAGKRAAACPKAIEMYNRLVSLPMYPGLSEEKVFRIADEIRKIIGSAKKTKVIPTRRAV
jgi:dTDP-4-amino-4,6-dideoxygalactose transaminase